LKTPLCCGRHTDGVNSSSIQIKDNRDNVEECAQLNDSMTGTINDSVGVTGFANEACEAVSVLGDYHPSAYSLPQNDLQDIKAYFARPRLINRGVLPFGSLASLFSTPSVTFDRQNTTLRDIFPQWDQRLAGAYGIRFTLNFRLQANVTSFHQGVLAMNWQYLASNSDQTNFLRGAFPFSCTNIPHVRMDLSELTMVELKIPFLHHTEFLPVNRPINAYSEDYGSLCITPILPAVSVVGIEPPSFLLYAFLTDIELFGVRNINPTTIQIQSGDILSREVKRSGVVSATLSNMGKIASFISRGVPSLSAIAGPAAWALDTASGVAKYFGYSKPMVNQVANRMIRSIYGFESQVDVPMVGGVLGLQQSNTTTVSTNLGATDVDEMSLAYVTSQWSQVARGFVRTVDSHGDAVYAAPVSPGAMWFRSSSGQVRNIRFPSTNFDIGDDGNSFYPTTLMYISSFFRLWRGSVKYRITFAKTKLHGGRYMITFQPYIQSQFEINNYSGIIQGPESVGGLRQPYGNSMIMDLKDGNVFEFTAPYSLEVPYINFVSAMGGISIVCMESLQATATVTNTVPFIVEVCGGDDFQLADYAGPYFPTNYGGIIMQSGDLVSRSTSDPSASTVGEKINSLKQLIMHPTPSQVGVGSNTTARYACAPWFVETSWLTLEPSSFQTPSAQNIRFDTSVGAALSKCYAFVKGGTDYHIYTNNNFTDVRAYQIANEFSASFPNVPNLFRRPFVSQTPKVQDGEDCAVHVRAPSFQTVVRIPARAYDETFERAVAPAFAGILKPYLSHFVAFQAENRTTSVRAAIVYRSASDDAMMAHFMGPVPIFVPNVLSTQPLDFQREAW
jgi:hypothetical protein